MSATAVIVEQKVEGINRTQLAKELGVSRTHVSLVLSGKNSPSLSVAVEIARKLGITLDDFYGYLQRASVN